MERRIEYRQLVYILSLFLIVQFGGLLAVFYFIPLPSIAAVEAPQASYSSVNEAIYYFFFIILGTILLLLIFKFYKGRRIYEIIEGIVVVSASFYFFAIILGGLFPQAGFAIPVLVVSFALPIFLLIEKYRHPSLRNTLAVISSIGAGVVLGLVFSFAVAFVFMAILAAYDYVSVFVTKHMLALGRQAMNKNMALMVSSSEVELLPKKYLDSRTRKEISKSIKLSKIKNKQVRQLIKQGSLPLPTQTALGTGDLAVPLMLAVSAYATYLSYFFAAAIASGAVAGIGFTMYVLRKYKIGLPAIPPLFSFICFALSLVVLPRSAFAFIGLLLIGLFLLALLVVTARRVSKEQGRSVF